jgi:hypothetical protein
MQMQLPSDSPRFWTRITGLDPADLQAYSNAPPSWRTLSQDSILQWSRAYRRYLPERINRLWKHILEAARTGGAWIVAVPSPLHPMRFLLWLRDGAYGLLAWTARLGSKGMDLLGTAEAWDFAGQIVKPKTRRLSPLELTEAKRVFGDCITWDKVRIDEHSAIASLGRRLLGYGGLGIVLGHTVHFSRAIQPAPGNGDMTWLIHELVHVLQCEAAGLQYIGEAVAAQYGEGYDYGGMSALETKPLADFNREQQADIAADFYRKVIYGHSSVDPFLPHIDDLRNRRI